ncbi:MAG TPA: hypothetical protein VHT51_17260, partial [Micropepsaceae bacterium]|nr:hypothetical protein [Micropepsaceae bacterium]
MSGERFASLSASLLVRKGEARPSAIMPPASFAFSQKSNAEPAAPRPKMPASSTRTSESKRRADLTAKRNTAIVLPPADSDTIGFIAVKRGVTRSQLLRLALEGCGDTVIVPVAVEQCSNGSVTLTVSDSAENFVHDEDADGWVGNCGSFLTGDADLFADATGW